MSTSKQILNSAETSTQPLNINQVSPALLHDGYFCQLHDQSLIEVHGEDAAQFLHNQLSNDVLHLNDTQSRYAAYCTPKGRMLASFLYWKRDDKIMLQCSASLQPGLQKRLQMFVMRSKVKLEDVSEQFVLLGLGGQSAQAFLLRHFSNLPEAINDKISNETGTLIRVHDAFEMPRFQWITTAAFLSTIEIPSHFALPQVNSSIWRLGHIHAGLPQVIEQSKEQFVPQMINFELIGGVNFKKGCYPGQEIVARSQYLGKLKRRMAIATVIANNAEVGMDIYSDNDTSQPCGMIVSAERNLEGQLSCLVEIKLADQEQGKVHLGSPEGPTLVFLPLPYAYLDVTE